MKIKKTKPEEITNVDKTKEYIKKLVKEELNKTNISKEELNKTEKEFKLSDYQITKEKLEESINKPTRIGREYYAQSLLYEGLIKTEPLESSIYRLRYLFELNSDRWLNLRPDENNNIIWISLNDFKDFEDIEFLLEIINNLGYFISTIYPQTFFENQAKFIKYSEKNLREILEKKQLFKNIDITIEAKYDIKFYPKGKLYHVCRQENLKKIKEIGLTPRAFSKIQTHPKRIYLTYSFLNALEIRSMFKKQEKDIIAKEKADNLLKGKIVDKNTKEEQKYAILEIDIDKLQKNRDVRVIFFNDLSFVRFFEDPNYKGKGCYTMENIPPDVIKVMKENY